jgi:6-phosphofructokinase 1
VTTAESHRRIAIVEVMGRHAGFLALARRMGSRPGIDSRTTRRHQSGRRASHGDLRESKNVVIVCGEGIVDESMRAWRQQRSTVRRATSAERASARASTDRGDGDDYFRERGG